MFDSAQFESVTGGDIELSQEIAELFAEDTRSLLVDLGTAVATSDDETIRRLAHTMKSSCASVGALPAAATAATIEARGLASERHLFQVIVQEVESAIESMTAFVASLGVPS